MEGPRGPTGPAGSAGIIGPQGIQGTRGPEGPTGGVGATGTQGIQGLMGVAVPRFPLGVQVFVGKMVQDSTDNGAVSASTSIQVQAVIDSDSYPALNGGQSMTIPGMSRSGRVITVPAGRYLIEGVANFVPDTNLSTLQLVIGTWTTSTSPPSFEPNYTIAGKNVNGRTITNTGFSSVFSGIVDISSTQALSIGYVGTLLTETTYTINYQQGESRTFFVTFIKI